MGLNYEGGGLFDRASPEVNTDPRAFKDGSTVKSFAWDAATAGTVYTIPTGYVLYIDTLFISQYDTGGGDLIITDNGTSKFTLNTLVTAGSSTGVNFSSPMVFETSLVNASGASCDMYVTASGWIEKG